MSDQSAFDFAGEFPILRELNFMNHAGVAPISGRAAKAINEYAEQARTRAYVQSGWYVAARRVKQSVARLLGAKDEREIAFVANTTSGLGLVARGIDWRAGDSVVITSVEFPANRYPWEDLRRLGVEVIEVPQLPDGRIDAEDVADAVTDRTRVVAISHVQYASGCRVNVKPIARMVHSAGGYLCVDAIQSLGALPFNVEEEGIDFLAADGHKWLLGPEGCGIFYARADVIPLLHPAIVGWMSMVRNAEYGQYRFELRDDARRFEPGSYNIPGILALGASVDLLLEFGIDKVWQLIESLTARLCDGLKDKGYRVFSPRLDGERSGIVTFDPPHGSIRHTPPPSQIVADLEKQAIVIALREGRLRASPHFYNSIEQVDALVKALP